MVRYKFTGLLMLSLLVSACTDAAFWLANRPVTLDHAITHTNIAYGELPLQMLDVYQPKDSDNAPVVVFFYGGGWQSGNRSDYGFVADALTRMGYVTVIADYRQYPDVTFPAFVEDSAEAVAWTYRNIAQHGGNPEKLFVMGHSAGAYNGAMLIADPHYLAAHQLTPDIVKAFAGLAGPYNFTPSSRKYRRIFNQMDDFSAMQVGSYIDGKEPPMLLLHGSADWTVSDENASSLAKQIKAKGGIADAKLYQDINHYEIIGVFSEYWKNKASIRTDIDLFFKQYQ